MGKVQVTAPRPAMYTHLQLAKKYLHYYLTASNGRGHGIHSPFVYDFIRHVLRDTKKYPAYEKIEALRRSLLRDGRTIEVEDMGAGSLQVPHRQKKISRIAAAFLKSPKLAQLLYRVARYYQPKTIVELGTSLGITTCYLAAATDAGLYTLEGSVATAGIAEENFRKAGLPKIEIVTGNFDTTLEPMLAQMQAVDMAFIDGNHRQEPTLRYFRQLLAKADDHSVFVLDDIHWSREMEAAWETIKTDPAVTLSIDLFFTGFVFFRKDFRVKQHFVIRF